MNSICAAFEVLAMVGKGELHTLTGAERKDQFFEKNTAHVLTCAQKPLAIEFFRLAGRDRICSLEKF
jgi:hypothetical protein